jgi:sec-independent protein translocase protein TatC
MPAETTKPEGAMSFLEHLEELRTRLFRCVIAYVIAFLACWYWSKPILGFLLDPVRRYIADGGDVVFLEVTEPFFVYMKASALAAVFVAAPVLLHQIWGFVSPGLYRNEKAIAGLFIAFGTFFLVCGGAFGYYVAVPYSAQWLLQVGSDFKAALTLSAAFRFLSRVILGMAVVFELPVVILFLARLGVVTPGWLLRHLRHAVVVIAIAAAVITPTGDALTMAVFAVPMIGLYLVGVVIAWIFGKKKAAA